MEKLSLNKYFYIVEITMNDIDIDIDIDMIMSKKRNLLTNRFVHIC